MALLFHCITFSHVIQKITDIEQWLNIEAENKCRWETVIWNWLELPLGKLSILCNFDYGV